MSMQSITWRLPARFQNNCLKKSSPKKLQSVYSQVVIASLDYSKVLGNIVSLSLAITNVSPGTSIFPNFRNIRMSYRFSSTLYLNIHPLLIRQLSRLYQNLIHMFLHSNRSNGLGPLHMYFYLNRYIFSIAYFSRNNICSPATKHQQGCIYGSAGYFR